MANRFYAIIIVLAVAALLIWNSLFVVNEREQALVLRFGEIQRVVEEPGLYFKWPFSFAGADTVQRLPDRLLRFDLDDIRVQVSGGRFYVVDAFLVYNITDAARFRQTVSGNVLQAEQRLRTRLDAALRRVYGLRGFEAALSSERAEMMRQVRDEIVADAASLGIEVNDVRIRRTDLTEEVSQQTYERMQAERLAEAERLRARGQVAAREIRAGSDREVVETVATARRDSEILQGQGDAERNRIFGEAFGANPEFFDFYRSMSAYRQALENSGTTMVLSPDSEFFRYFNGDAGTLPGVAARLDSGPSETAPESDTDAASDPSGAADEPAPQSPEAQSGDTTDTDDASASAASPVPGVALPEMSEAEREAREMLAAPSSDSPLGVVVEEPASPPQAGALTPNSGALPPTGQLAPTDTPAPDASQGEEGAADPEATGDLVPVTPPAADGDAAPDETPPAAASQ